MSGAGCQSTSANFRHRHSAFLFPAARLCPLITGYFRPLVGDKHSIALTTGLVLLAYWALMSAPQPPFPSCLLSAHCLPCSGHLCLSPNHPLFRRLFCLEVSAPIFGPGNSGSFFAIETHDHFLVCGRTPCSRVNCLINPDTVAGNKERQNYMEWGPRRGNATHL